MVILDYNDISKLIDFDLSLKWIKEYFTLKEENQILEPQRFNFASHNKNNHVYLGGASIQYEEKIITGFKNVNYFKDNFEKFHLSNIFGSISIIDSNNGIIKLIADARRITYMRTVASMAFFLEKRVSNGEKIGIIGAGQMLYYTIGFLTKISSTRKFSIYSKRINNRIEWLKFIEKEFSVSFKITSVDNIIKNSETLIVATNEFEDHVVESRGNLKNICAIGSISKLYKGELSLEVYRSIKNVVCDDIDAVYEEHGSISKLKNEIELEMVNNNLNIYSPRIFRSVGLMSQDIYFAYKALNLIKNKNIYNIKKIDNLDLSNTWNPY